MKEKIRKLFFVLSLLLIIAGAAYLVFYFVQKEMNKNIYDKVQKYRMEEKTVQKDDEEEEEEIVIPIDFPALKAINSDIYAWIDIEDTNIHYPIVQSSIDDSYYLKRTIDGKRGYPGSIYTQMGNQKDFSDFNTVIYGHDMKDGTMFKHLHRFADAEFFRTHETIMIYTETEIKEYRVYAAVMYDKRHILDSFEQSDMEARKAFIQTIVDSKNFRNQFREGMTIDENSKLITLSTCITGYPSRRFIVVAEEVVD